MPGLTGIGAAIRDPEGNVNGAISVIGPTSRLTDDRLEEITEMINQTENVIEVNLTAL